MHVTLDRVVSERNGCGHSCMAYVQNSCRANAVCGLIPTLKSHRRLGECTFKAQSVLDERLVISNTCIISSVPRKHRRTHMLRRRLLFLGPSSREY